MQIAAVLSGEAMLLAQHSLYLHPQLNLGVKIMNADVKTILARGEAAAQIETAKRELLLMLLNYKNKFGGEDAIDAVMQDIGESWSSTGAKQLFHTDVYAAYDRMKEISEYKNQERVTSGVYMVIADDSRQIA